MPHGTVALATVGESAVKPASEDVQTIARARDRLEGEVLADLTACDFKYTSFGATDIMGATITKARFSGTSCFTLNFIQTRDMQECAYIHSDGQTSEMSNPPIVIHGTNAHPIIIMDNTIKSAQTIVKQRNIRQIAQRATAKLAATKYG